MLILIKFSAEIFQPRKEIQSIRVSLRGTIYGILAVCDWLLLGQTLGNAVPLSDYFLLSFGNYKLQQCSLGAPFAEPVCVWASRGITSWAPAGERGHRYPHHHNQFTHVTNRPTLPPPLQKVIAAQLSRNETVTHWGGDVRTALSGSH